MSISVCRRCLYLLSLHCVCILGLARCPSAFAPAPACLCLSPPASVSICSLKVFACIRLSSISFYLFPCFVSSVLCLAFCVFCLVSFFVSGLVSRVSCRIRVTPSVWCLYMRLYIVVVVPVRLSLPLCSFSCAPSSCLCCPCLSLSLILVSEFHFGSVTAAKCDCCCACARVCVFQAFEDSCSSLCPLPESTVEVASHFASMGESWQAFSSTSKGKSVSVIMPPSDDTIIIYCSSIVIFYCYSNVPPFCFSTSASPPDIKHRELLGQF